MPLTLSPGLMPVPCRSATLARLEERPTGPSAVILPSFGSVGSADATPAIRSSRKMVARAAPCPRISCRLSLSGQLAAFAPQPGEHRQRDQQRRYREQDEAHLGVAQRDEEPAQIRDGEGEACLSRLVELELARVGDGVVVALGAEDGAALLPVLAGDEAVGDGLGVARRDVRDDVA